MSRTTHDGLDLGIVAEHGHVEVAVEAGTYGYLVTLWVNDPADPAPHRLGASSLDALTERAGRTPGIAGRPDVITVLTLAKYRQIVGRVEEDAR